MAGYVEEHHLVPALTQPVPLNERLVEHPDCVSRRISPLRKDLVCLQIVDMVGIPQRSTGTERLEREQPQGFEVESVLVIAARRLLPLSVTRRERGGIPPTPDGSPAAR